MAETKLVSETPMQLGCIDSGQLAYFSTLLIKDAVHAIERGEPVTAIGITQKGVACGALAGYVENGCFQVISLYVAPAYRRLGGGRLMLDQLEELLREEREIHSMEISYTMGEPDNETLAPFLAAMGFAPEDDKGRNIFTFTLGQMAGAKVWKPAVSKSLRIRPFSQLSEYELYAVQRRGIVQGAPLPEDALTSPQLEREISHALIREGKVEAYAVFDHSCCGALTLCGLWVGDTNPVALYSLLKTVFLRAAELYPPQTRIALQTVNDQSARLIGGLVPDAQKVSFTYRRFV